MSTSATGGFLAPSRSMPVPDGDELTDILQAAVSAITGIDGQYVRPRWQPEPLNIPPLSVTWVGMGITGRNSDTYAYQWHRDDENGGYNSLWRNEELTLLCSFYGPCADEMASRLRDGLAIEQNRECLLSDGVVFVACGDITAAPEMLNQRWLYRVDMPVMFRRGVLRRYQILSLETAQGGATAQTDAGHTLATELTDNNHG